MFDAIKPLLDAGIINEDTQVAINEAWETKLTEARESIRAELREEFAQRYEHDKAVMVEALDNMVTESLTSEIQEFQDEKRALAEDRVKFKAHMVESAGKFNTFMVSKLASEIKELREDRKTYQNSVAKLEQFVIKALAEEIGEFEQDKRAVVEARVRLVQEAKDKLATLQQQFVKRSSELVREAVSKNLETELTQLKEDIQSARENMFGRRIFEAFAGEFAVTHLNENREIAKLMAEIGRKEQKLQEARKAVEKAAVLVETKDREIRIIKESAGREDKLSQLLKPLNAEKGALMRELLESVQTEKLQTAFDKYLPAVLNQSGSVKKDATRAVLSESTVVTGNKTAQVRKDHESVENVIEIKRLAGLK
jgi:predicted DNA-binding protein